VAAKRVAGWSRFSYPWSSFSAINIIEDNPGADALRKMSSQENMCVLHAIYCIVVYLKMIHTHLP